MNVDRLLRRLCDVDGQASSTKAAATPSVSAPQFVQMMVAPLEGEAGAAPAPAETQPCGLELHNARVAMLSLQLPTLLMGGDPQRVNSAPNWRQRGVYVAKASSSGAVLS